MKLLGIIALWVLLSSCGCSRQPDPFPLGTKVQHKTGGPEFVVCYLSGDNRHVDCRYFNVISGKYEMETFDVAELEQVR